MHLSCLYSKLFLEYGGLDFGRISLSGALEEADRDTRSIIAIQCPQSGHHDRKLNNQGFHQQLIKKALDDDIRDAWYAVRAYWVPATGKLMLYQVETPGGHMIDPPEELISRLARNLNIHDKIMSIDIIE